MLVPSTVECAQRQGAEDGPSVDRHDGVLGRVVIGRIAGLEGLRADDIGNGERYCDSGAACNLASVATVVGAASRQDKGVRGNGLASQPKRKANG